MQGGALTLGLFKKDISSFLTTQSAFETIPGEPQQYLVTRTVNGQGGKLKGVEALLQLPFTFLPSPLDGFGIVANYSYIDSSTPFINRRTGEGLTLQGLSKHNINMIAYYEKGGFGIRGAYNYRSTFLDGVTAGGEGTFFKPYSTIDASVRYDFGKFGISAELANITNEKQVRYTGSPEAVALYAEQGRRFSVGISYKY
jgi:iron complex outermembrane recepter protein